MRKKVGGLFTALLTPFDSGGGVDDGGIERLVEFQLEKGTEGLYVCGTTGLGPMLKTEERKAVAETVVTEASGKVPVVVQVGSADTASTVELAKHAEKIGADAVASLTPYYYKPGERAIIRHFEAVAKEVTIPLFAYNIPQFTGNNLIPNLVAQLASKGTIVGIKDSCRDFLQLLDTIDGVPDDFVVMNGTEEYALFAIMSGADGLVSGGANAFPEIFKALVEAQRASDYRGALAAQQTVLKVKEGTGTSPISAYYEVLRSRGVDCGEPRAPILPLTKTEKKKMFAAIKKLDFW